MRIFFNYGSDLVLILDQRFPEVTKYEIYSHGKLIEESVAYMSAKAISKQAITRWKYVDLDEMLEYE